MGQLRIMGMGGDTKLMWSAENVPEVENARRTFDDLRATGYNAYSVGEKGKKGELITQFDPDAERIILAPAMKGGS